MIGLALVLGCHDGLEPGAPAPRITGQSNGVAIVWLARPADCLNCQSPAWALRHLQNRLGERLAVVAVEVGGNERIMSDFLRVHRVRHSLVNVGGIDFSDAFGDLALPAIYVTRNGRVESVWESANEVRAATMGEEPALVEAVLTIFAEMELQEAEARSQRKPTRKRRIP